MRNWGDHLEASEQSLGEGVKSTSLHLSLVKVEFASEQLHAQQGEDDEEEEEQEQKGADSFHGVEQRVDQVRQSSPVSGDNKIKDSIDHTQRSNDWKAPDVSVTELWHQLPSHLEYPEQSDAAEHGDADGRDDLHLHKQCLEDTAAHHKAIEAVEQRHEIDLQAKRVHLHQHLEGEQQQQDLVGSLWETNRERSRVF